LIGDELVETGSAAHGGEGEDQSFTASGGLEGGAEGGAV